MRIESLVAEVSQVTVGLGDNRCSPAIRDPLGVGAPAVGDGKVSLAFADCVPFPVACLGTTLVVAFPDVGDVDCNARSLKHSQILYLPSGDIPPQHFLSSSVKESQTCLLTVGANLRGWSAA